MPIFAASPCARCRELRFRRRDEISILIRWSEINMDGGYLSLFHGHEFCVGELPPIGEGEEVCHERFVAFGKNPLDHHIVDFAVHGPAALKIRGAVDAIVIGAGKGQILRNDLFDDGAIVGFIRLETPGDNALDRIGLGDRCAYRSGHAALLEMKRPAPSLTR